MKTIYSLLAVLLLPNALYAQTNLAFTAPNSSTPGSFNVILNPHPQPGTITSMTGTNNVFIGASAGQSNQGGVWNVIIGQNAGYLNMGGSFNTFLGGSAGYKNQSGNWNNVSFGAAS